MRKRTVILILLALFAFGGTVAPFTTIFMRTVLDDEDAATARTTLAIGDHEFQPLHLAERSSDPPEPSIGTAIIWMSDGTGFGGDGDMCMASNPDGTTRKAILFRYDMGDTW